jgi:hypothetical protein
VAKFIVVVSGPGTPYFGGVGMHSVEAPDSEAARLVMRREYHADLIEGVYVAVTPMDTFRRDAARLTSGEADLEA